MISGWRGTLARMLGHPLVIFTSVGILSFIGVRVLTDQGRTRTQAHNPVPDTAVTVQAVAGGVPSASADLLVVFLGASRCAWSEQKRNQRALTAAAAAVRQEAEHRHLRASVVGIAADEKPQDGLNYLGGFEGLDEVIAGPGWRGRGMGWLLRDLIPSSGTTPELLIVERQGARQKGPTQETRVLVVRLRAVGGDQIERWLARGARVPAAVSSAITAHPVAAVATPDGTQPPTNFAHAAAVPSTRGFCNATNA